MVRVKCCTQGNQICYHNGLSTCLTDLVGQSWWGKGYVALRLSGNPVVTDFSVEQRLQWWKDLDIWYGSEVCCHFLKGIHCFTVDVQDQEARAGKKINPIVTFPNIDLLYSSQHIDGLEQDCSISIANTLGYCSLAPSHRNLSHNVCGCADWPSLEPNICSEWLSQ